MSKKKCYVIDVYPYLTENIASITIDYVFLDKHKAELYFSEMFMESCRANDTTRKCDCFGNLLGMFSYETLSNQRTTCRLREMDIMD